MDISSAAIYADVDPFGHSGPHGTHVLLGIAGTWSSRECIGSITGMSGTLSVRIRVAGAPPSSPQPAAFFARTDCSDWALCFFSFTMLLSGSWTAQKIGTTAVVSLFLLPWVWIAARNPNATIGRLVSNWPVLALPLFALLSTAWSDYPLGTLRGGTQYLLTAIIGVLAGSCVKPRTMLGALFWALAFVTALGLLVPQNEVSSGEAVLTGLFGSKNYLGYSYGLLLLTATIVAFDRSRRGMVRLIAFAVAAVSPVLLVLSGSTGALVCSMAAMAVTCVLAFVIRFAPAVRVACLLLMALLVVLFLIVWLYVVDFAALLGFLGKDVTLTGRTLIWEWAYRAIEQHPMLGTAFGGFWQAGNWGAEEIWFQFARGKTGYHFHNTFLQIAVDLGYVGLLVFLATLAAISARIGSCLLFSRLDTEQMFAIAMFLFHLFRLPIEVDLFWQFQIPTVLLSMIWVYLGLPGRRRSGEPRASAFSMRSPLRLGRTHPVKAHG